MVDIETCLPGKKGGSSITLQELFLDMATGLLMIVLYGPFVYALVIELHARSADDFLVSIFPEFFSVLRTTSLSSFAPWLLIILSVVLGAVSRAVFAIYSFIPAIKVIEKVLLICAYRHLVRFHGLPPSWTEEKISARLLARSPFQYIGTSEYADFRANLDDPNSAIGKFKPYWQHEELAFLKSMHFYGLFLNFPVVYLVYGAGVILWKGMPSFHLMCIWGGSILLSFLLAICLLKEVIVHGIAFIQIDRYLADLNTKD